MQRLELSGVVRPIYGSLGVKRLNSQNFHQKGKFICQVWGYRCVEILVLEAVLP